MWTELTCTKTQWCNHAYSVIPHFPSSLKSDAVASKRIQLQSISADIMTLHMTTSSYVQNQAKSGSIIRIFTHNMGPFKTTRHAATAWT